jgi:small conductance mechanosensitive channel
MPKELAQLDRSLDLIIGFLVTYSFQIIGAIVILVVGLKLTAMLARLVQGLLERNRVDATLSRFLANLFRMALIVILGLIVAGQFGVNVTPLIAAVGAATLGITVALQGVLSNYAAGVTIVLTRPFRIGDTVTVRGVNGLVEDITLPATILRGDDGERITVPNRQIIGEILVNSAGWTIVDTRITLPHDADTARAIAAMRQVLEQAEPLKGAPPAQVGVLGFSELGVMLGIRYWAPTRDYFPARFAITDALRAALAQAGQSIVGGAELRALRG